MKTINRFAIKFMDWFPDNFKTIAIAQVMGAFVAFIINVFVNTHSFDMTLSHAILKALIIFSVQVIVFTALPVLILKYQDRS